MSSLNKNNKLVVFTVVAILLFGVVVYSITQKPSNRSLGIDQATERVIVDKLKSHNKGVEYAIESAHQLITDSGFRLIELTVSPIEETDDNQDPQRMVVILEEDEVVYGPESSPPGFDLSLIGVPDKMKSMVMELYDYSGDGL